MLRRLSARDLLHFRESVRQVFVDRDVIGYAVSLADATRNPPRGG